MAADEVYLAVGSALKGLGVNTDPEVHAFRVPGERWDNKKSPTAGKMFSVINTVQTQLGRQWVSRKRVRSTALRLLREGNL